MPADQKYNTLYEIHAEAFYSISIELTDILDLKISQST